MSPRRPRASAIRARAAAHADDAPLAVGRRLDRPVAIAAARRRPGVLVMRVPSGRLSPPETAGCSARTSPGVAPEARHDLGERLGEAVPRPPAEPAARVLDVHGPGSNIRTSRGAGIDDRLSG